jgi:cell division protein FtsQ
MKQNSVLDNQLVKRHKRKKDFLPLKRFFGQLGFGLIKIFLFFLGLGILSLAFIAGYQFFSSSQFFRLNNIVVAGVHDDFKEELIRISGIKENENLLFIESSKIRKNIERHARIKSVCVKKEFPHTLHIKAENEEAVAIVILGKMSFMNREGIIFKDVEDNDCIDFPVVTGLSQGNEKDGASLKRVASFLNTIHSYDNDLLVRDLSEIHIEEDGTFVLYFNNLPFKVFFGRDDFKRKIDALREIISHLKSTDRLDQVRSIDLDYKDRVVVAFQGRVV